MADQLANSISKYGFSTIKYQTVFKGGVIFTECKVSNNDDTITSMVCGGTIMDSIEQSSLLVLQ